MLMLTTGGKDRTGVLSAIFLSLAGHNSKEIAEDFILTRIGVETKREMLTQGLKTWLGQDAMEQEGVFEISSSNSECMIGFLKLMDEKYNGPVGYCKRILGFSDEDLNKIRENIVAAQ